MAENKLYCCQSSAVVIALISDFSQVDSLVAWQLCEFLFIDRILDVPAVAEITKIYCSSKLWSPRYNESVQLSPMLDQVAIGVHVEFSQEFFHFTFISKERNYLTTNYKTLNFFSKRWFDFLSIKFVLNLFQPQPLLLLSLILPFLLVFFSLLPLVSKLLGLCFPILSFLELFSRLVW